MHSHKSLEELFDKIKRDSIDESTLDNLANDVEFSLNMQYFDFCVEQKKTKTNDNLIPIQKKESELDILFRNEDIFTEFSKYLDHSSYLYLSRDIWEYMQLLYSVPEDKKLLKKSKSL